LNRAAESLKVLANEAEASSNGCLGAVSHSTFIRILIGMVLDEPLAEAASRKIDNGSITIIDIPNDFKTRGIGSNPRLLGGALSQAPSDLEVEIPICKIVRINESRHLPEIPKGKVLPER
jgi:broad specificity phosphatase PhoE